MYDLPFNYKLLQYKLYSFVCVFDNLYVSFILVTLINERENSEFTKLSLSLQEICRFSKGMIFDKRVGSPWK